MAYVQFWLQEQNAFGNWLDSLGSENIANCISHGEWIAKEKGRNVRVVQRVDSTIWSMDAVTPAKDAWLNGEKKS